MHTTMVNSRHSSRSRSHRTQAERRQQTRQALLDAALDQVDAGEGFDTLSLRSVARAAGVVPTAFYRYFASMDELGLVLIEDSVRSLRTMLRQARDAGIDPDRMIGRSVGILVDYVRANRREFVFIARIRGSGNTVLRHTLRSEIRLFVSELATDLARLPVVSAWSTEDLQMLAGLLVTTMIQTIESLLDAAPDSGEAIAEITTLAERQLRLIVVGVPGWRSGRSPGARE